MKTELKACPWCGDAPNVDDEGSLVLTDGIKYGALRCCITGPEVRTDYKPVEHWKGAAIEAWNDRATAPSPSTAEVDERAARPAVEAGELPPLPKPCPLVIPAGWIRYTEQALRDYGQECIRAALATKPATRAPGATGERGGE